jgi:hypothetical protein
MARTLQAYRLLPTAQFVAQPVRFVRDPVEVWRSAQFHGLPVAIGTPVSVGEEALFGDPAGLAYVERYGGMGIGRNGGGARCALYAGMVVKGFGASALGGRGQDYWHSFGGLSLREAVREAVWGETLNQLLPHGAVQTEAVVLTGGEVPLHYPDSAGRAHAPRALSFRRPFVRLAHFLPATLFLPNRAHEGQLLPEDARTRESILSLPRVLACLYGEQAPDADLMQQLELLFRRCGTQAGAARALRLVHGSITASNIGLDGRLLDFGMTSAVSDFGRVRTVRGFPDAWGQSTDLHQAIALLLRYVARHLRVGSRFDASAEATRLSEVLRDAEAGAYESGLIDQVGIPREILSARLARHRCELGKALREVSESGCEPFKLLCPCDNYRPHMPEQMGRYHLGRVLAAYWAGTARGDWQDFDAQLAGRPIRERLLSALESVRRAVLASQPGLDAATLAQLARTACMRRHDPLMHLQHAPFNAAIDALDPVRQDVTGFVERTVSKAVGLLAPPDWTWPEAAPSARRAHDASGANAADERGEPMTQPA